MPIKIIHTCVFVIFNWYLFMYLYTCTHILTCTHIRTLIHVGTYIYVHTCPCVHNEFYPFLHSLYPAAFPSLISGFPQFVPTSSYSISSFFLNPILIKVPSDRWALNRINISQRNLNITAANAYVTIKFIKKMS